MRKHRLFKARDSLEPMVQHSTPLSEGAAAYAYESQLGPSLVAASYLPETNAVVPDSLDDSVVPETALPAFDAPGWDSQAEAPSDPRRPSFCASPSQQQQPLRSGASAGASAGGLGPRLPWQSPSVVPNRQPVFFSPPENPHNLQQLQQQQQFPGGAGLPFQYYPESQARGCTHSLPFAPTFCPFAHRDAKEHDARDRVLLLLIACALLHSFQHRCTCTLPATEKPNPYTLPRTGG